MSSTARTSLANRDPELVSMQAAEPFRGFKIPAPPPSGVRLAAPALVISGVTSARDTAPRKRHVAAECDYCATGERHPAWMF